MHLRKLVVACGLATFAMSNLASALGLGEVKLKSTLNQPLSAEVQLLDTKGLSEDQILVALASPADFERNGVERLYFYSEFKFQVDLKSPSGPIIKVTSKNPVREPYLNFLIEAKWASGRLLREYTLLMDLPTFSEAPASTAVQSAQTQTQVNATKKVERQVTPTSSSQAEETPDVIAQNDKETALASSKKSTGANSTAGTYGPVNEKDTLWDIAKAIRPDSSVSVHQTMLALHRMNPDAFIRGNINLIKKGQVLRVPDVAEATSISKSEAASQFAVLSNTPTGTSTAATDMGAQLDASRRSSGAKHSEEAGAGRVKLEAPASAEKAATGGQGSGSNKGSSKALERELATTLEELDRAKSEKSELSSRVHDLEEQVKTMQKLVDVSNEKLRTLQVNAQKTAEAAKKADPKVVDTKADAKLDAAAAKASVQAESSVSSVAASSAPAVAEQVASAQPAPKEKPKKTPKPVTPPPPPPEKSLVDILMDNIVAVGGAAGLVVLGGAALAMRRRKAQSAEAAQANETFDAEPDFAAFNSELDDSSVNESSAFGDEISPLDDDVPVTEAETGDVVGEADIYIAYGKFDQAEEMLLNGLKKDPASTEIRMKLLEVYSQTQNLQEFDKHYAVILPLATGFALSRAAELRAEIPGAGEFDSMQSVAESASAEIQDEFALDDLALDDFDEPANSPLSANSLTASAADEEFNLDLDDVDLNDLDKPNHDYQMSADAASIQSAPDLDDDFVLDFDSSAATTAESEVGDINFALDNLDSGLPEDDLEVAAAEEEFSFDFNELEEPTSSLAEEVGAIKSSEFDESLEQGDDFNFDMDVPNTDLAALDKEFDSLDDELEFEPLDAGDVAALSESTEFSGASELSLEDMDSDLDFQMQSDLASLDASLDDSVATSSNFSEGASSDIASFGELSGDSLELENDSLSLDDELTLDFAESSAEAPLSMEAAPSYATEGNQFEEQNSSLVLDDVLLNEFDTPVVSATTDFVVDEFDVESDDFALEDLDLGDANAELEAELSSFESSESSANFLAEQVDSNSSTDFSSDFSLSEEPEQSFGSELNLESDGQLASLENSFDSNTTDSDFASLDNELSNSFVSDSDVALVSNESSLVEEPVPELSEEDDMFEQALSDFSAEDFNVENLDEMTGESDDDLDFMAEADEAATKLDLARAYMDMGDNEGARDILAEVAHEGNEVQRQEAEELLNRIDA